MAAEPDDELVAAARLGDRAAFGRLADRHGPALRRFAGQLVHDRGEAEDVVQESLVAAWLSIDRFRGASSVSTWLFGITANKARDSRRRRRPTPTDPSILPDLDLRGPTAAVPGDNPLFLHELRLALAALPQRQRECWLLTQVEGLSQEEAATALRMTTDAVRGQVGRARSSLRERLRDWR